MLNLNQAAANALRKLGLGGAIRVFSAAAALILQLLLVRIVGVDGYGAYAYFYVIASFAFILSKLGLDVSLIRDVVHFQAEGRGVLGLWKASLIRVLLSSAAVSFLAVFILTVFSEHFAAAEWMYYLLFPFVFLLCAFGVTQAVMRGQGQVIWADALENVFRPPLVCVLAYAFLSIWGLFSGGAGLSLVFLFSTLLIFVSASWFVKKEAGSKGAAFLYRATGKVLLSAKEIREGLSITVISLLGFLLFQYDKIVLGGYVDSAELGAYNMACNYVRLVPFFAMILVAQFQPRFAEFWVKNDRTNYFKALVFSSGAAMGAALLGVVGLLFFGERLLAYANPAYVRQYIPLLVLGAGHVFNSFVIVASASLLMASKDKSVLWSQVSGGLVALFSYYLLIPPFGSLGAALSAALGMFVSAAHLAVVARKIKKESLG